MSNRWKEIVGNRWEEETDRRGGWEQIEGKRQRGEGRGGEIYKRWRDTHRREQIERKRQREEMEGKRQGGDI